MKIGARRLVPWLLSTLLLLPAAAVVQAASDAEAEWQRGFQLQLPATARSIVLEAGIDAPDWARRMGLNDVRIEALPGRGTVLNLEMQDAAWAQLQARACQQSGVVACENTSCQQIQLGGRVKAGPGLQSFQPRLRLLRRPPSVESLLQSGASGDYCPQDEGEFTRELPLLSRPPQSANFELDPAQMPQDTQCWDLVIESACHISRTPLQSLVPARESRRVLGVLPGIGNSAAAAVASHLGLRVLRQVDLVSLNESLVVLELPVGVGVDGVLPLLLADSNFREAWPEHIFTTSALHSDPYAALAYGPAAIGADRLHARATGRGVRVAVIDTGVDHENPELDIVAEHHDVTGRGWSADLHGTAIAGIIGARADNNLGGYGVAPDVELLAIKACQPVEPGKLGANCWTSTLVQAIDLAIQKRARIINMSLGGPPDRLLARYIRAARERGHLVIAAAGNGGELAKPAFPAALEDAVAVTAIDAGGRLYRHATIGDFVELAAPGVDIVSVAPGAEFPLLSGTSMAAAHVSGLAALLLQLAPGTLPEDLRTGLQDSAADLGDPGSDERFGRGRVDGCQAASRLASGDTGCGGQ